MNDLDKQAIEKEVLAELGCGISPNKGVIQAIRATLKRVEKLEDEGYFRDEEMDCPCHRCRRQSEMEDRD